MAAAPATNRHMAVAASSYGLAKPPVNRIRPIAATSAVRGRVAERAYGAFFDDRMQVSKEDGARRGQSCRNSGDVPVHRLGPVVGSAGDVRESKTSRTLRAQLVSLAQLKSRRGRTN